MSSMTLTTRANSPWRPRTGVALVSNQRSSPLARSMLLLTNGPAGRPAGQDAAPRELVRRDRPAVVPHRREALDDVIDRRTHERLRRGEAHQARRRLVGVHQGAGGALDRHRLG